VSPVRKVIHVDMDAFYASVEQRDDPALRGRPVVVAWRGARSVVCAASYEARVFGVRSAMPALRAERLCPDAVFVPPDFVRYREASRQIRAIFARHTALVEPLSLDEAYLDVTVPRSDLSSATAIAKSIRAEIFETTRLTASAGVAPNKFVAKIASDWRKPDGLFVVPPSKVEAFLAPLPVARLPGVGRVTGADLAALGIATVSDLRRAGRERLVGRFGRWGGRLHELAWGIDRHPVEPERPHSQISSEDTFEQDLPLEELAPQVARMAARTWDAYLRQRAREVAEGRPPRQPRTVVLKLKTARFRILTRSLTPPRPPDDGATLARMACALLGRVCADAATRYRLVGVGLANLAASGPQEDLFEPVELASSADG
jgi:DNA polymerase-4